MEQVKSSVSPSGEPGEWSLSQFPSYAVLTLHVSVANHTSAVHDASTQEPPHLPTAGVSEAGVPQSPVSLSLLRADTR